jgi:hypothetical protein
MRELGQFVTLLTWVGIISVVIWGLEQVAARFGYRVKTIDEHHAEQEAAATASVETNR